MVTRDQVLQMENLFSEYTIKRVHADAAHATFQKEHERIRDLLKKGETTGDQILDWALSGEYPYQEREQSARKVYNYLQEHVGDYFFFSDREYFPPWKTHLYVGKISPPPLIFTKNNLSIGVEEGTLVYKIVYGVPDFTNVKNPSSNDRDKPFIEGLIIVPYQQKDGLIESVHSPFSDDEEYYALGAGQKNVLSYLHQKKIISEATKECLEALIMRPQIAGESDPDSYWTT
ncbi:MAG: hypothetical protein Q8R47_01430 [Nanoarchaeota archaeon]|nr:hypothetical protein [Nanoarchaeota archaeon]